MDPQALLPLVAAATLAGAVILLAANGELDRVGAWMLIGGWFLFALTSPTFQFPLALRPVGLVLAGAGALLLRLTCTDPPRRVGSASLPTRLLFVFVVFVLLGCLQSPYGPSNLVRGVEGVLIVASALYGVSLGLGSWLVGGVLAAALANVVLSIISGAPEVVPGVHGDPERLSGFMQPNHLAFAAAIVLIGVAGLWAGNRRFRLLLLGAAGLATYALLASRSRTGLIALLIAVGVVGAASVAPAARLRAMAIGLLALLALVPLAGGVSQGWFDRNDASGSNIASLTGRTDLWPPVIDLIKRRPIVGWGVDAVNSPAGEKVQEVLPGIGQAHNAYLEAGLMGGLPAALAWGLSLAAALVGSWRLPRLDPRRFGLIAIAVLLELYAITESSPAWFGDMFICYVLLVAIHSEARAEQAAAAEVPSSDRARAGGRARAEQPIPAMGGAR